MAARIAVLAETTAGEDPRMIGVGVEAIMVCRESDWLARLALLELRAGYRVVTA